MALDVPLEFILSRNKSVLAGVRGVVWCGVGKKHENLSPKSAKTRRIRHRRQDCRPRSQFSILFQYLCFKMSLEERGIYHQIVQFFLLIYNMMPVNPDLADIFAS